MENTLEEKCRRLLSKEDFSGCRKLIERELSNSPDSPVPQNLLGILEEKQYEKTSAIRHYRAAYALDPTYCPAIWNLERLGTGDVTKECAFSEKDCR